MGKIYNILRKVPFLKSVKQYYKDTFPFKVILHGDVISQRAFLKTIQETLPTAIVETGTYFGWTSEFLAKHFPNIPVYTCEINPRYYKKSKKKLSKYSNVKIYKGSSPDFLKLLVDKNLLGERPFFYLDAHWGNEWPLKKELLEISESVPSAIFAIDDFKVPGDSHFDYDTYNSEECSIEILEKSLSKKNNYSLLFPAYEKEQAYKPDIRHVDSLVGYVIIFQNLQKQFKSFSQSEFSKKFFKEHKLNF